MASSDSVSTALCSLSAAGAEAAIGSPPPLSPSRFRLILMGAGFSLYLTGVMVLVLHKYCIFCLALHGIHLLMALLFLPVYGSLALGLWRRVKFCLHDTAGMHVG